MPVLPGKNPSDKRRHPRHEVQGVHGKVRFRFEAEILNLSLEGMALETGTWLHVGRSYRLQLEDGDGRLDLDGRVAWCRLSHTRPGSGGDAEPVYRAGIRFEEVLTDSADSLRRFMERNAIVRVEDRLFGRFEASTDVGVETERSFEVVKLSLAGMQIRVDGDWEVALEHRFSLVLPTSTAPGEDPSPPPFDVRVADVRPDLEDDSQLLLGVEFLHLDETGRERLTRLLTHHG